MKTAIIPITEASQRIADTLQRETNGEILTRNDVPTRWHDFEAFVFIGAMGICVRTIAPLIEDKHVDPAVVCVDATCRHVVSVLSGHVGGANRLTQVVAAALGATPVITTQSDLSGLWSLDTLDQQFGWSILDTKNMNPCIFAYVNGEPTALLLDVHDAGTDYLLRTLPKHVTLIGSDEELIPDRFRLVIIVSPFQHQVPQGVLSLQYVPKVATIGFGLAHQASPAQQIYDEINQALAERGILPCAREWCSIDVKADEPFVELLRSHGHAVRFFTADELAAIEVPTPSATVEKHVGTPSVCEAAAILGSRLGQALEPLEPLDSLESLEALEALEPLEPLEPLESLELLVPKIKGRNWTAALAMNPSQVVALNKGNAASGHIEFVGAGPGDPDLVSVRGRRFLEQADLILYAGSLVPRELTDCHKAGAVVRSSASMALEEQCALMKEHYDQGHLIVRLHTGDPCIFGAIQEQMAFLDAHKMSYHITPGISSFLAAAAELRSQFTIPERTQTIILTRGEGRTPMPEREKLHLLARSQSTMCIFLSAAIVDDVQRELLQEYPAETPVAACYHLTWPDQRIYRGQLKNLSQLVHDNGLTLTTMLVIGEAIDNRAGLSELYNRHFTHLYRKSDSPHSQNE